MRSPSRFVAVFAVAAAVLMMFPMLEKASAQIGSGIVISEYRFRGTNGINDEFVELFNAGTTPVNVGGWMIRASANNFPTSIATRATIPANTIIQPGCYFLVVNNSSTGGYSGGVPGNLTYITGFGDDGGVALTTNVTTQIVDQVGQGTQPTAFGEGQRLPMLTTNANRGVERRPGGTAGHVDTNDNLSDFREIFPGHPQNAQSACLVPANIAITTSASAPSVEQGQSLTVFGLVTPGTVPPSTGVQVTGNLTALGGSAATAFADNGVAPDVVANDNIYSAGITVPPGNPLGPRSITLTASDAQGRTATHAISVTVTQPAVIYRPHEIQGAGPMSPMALGTAVTVRGVVTARKANGFFLQTESGMEDADANTSDGLFVLANGSPLAAAQVGHVVNVTAAVAELVPVSDPACAPLTALVDVTSVFDLGSGPVPAPVQLTSAEVSDAGTLDQLERFEGMRVHVATLVAVSGTGGIRNESSGASVSDGAFHAVQPAQPRPFREPGVESGYPVLPCEAGPCNVPIFDGNPQRLRVDSDGLEGVPAVDVSTAAVLTDVIGPLDFDLRAYTILPEVQLNPVGGMSIVAAPAPTSDQFTVASLNLDRFFDTSVDASDDVAVSAAAYQNRLAKASLTIRAVLNMPDVVGVQDAENVGVLNALSQAIDADAVAAGQVAPHYEAHLLDGSDPNGLDVGFLIKTAGSRVTVNSVEQVGAAAVFVDPTDASEHALYSRPPLMLRATIAGPSTELPQAITVVVNQMLSPAGAGSDDSAGALVREHRRAQAEFLATFLQVRQSNDPSEAIVALGEFGAFSFNDGYVDSLGTVTGDPAAPDQVVLSSPDLVSPDLVNVTELAPVDQRYSSLSNGNAQALDHVLATANLGTQFAGVVRPRVNADFPEVWRGDATTPGRLSDRDPVVVYFTFPPDVLAPVLGGVPGDRVAEATGPAGAAVSFSTPSATDNLDPFVAVACAPVSGSVFPLGNSGVTCSAQDVAGNVATASFTVTVIDTTAPALSLPGHLTAEASSPAGRVMSFTSTATDAVTPSPAVTCTPASGSTFAVGDTVVTCTAADAAGNVATGSFTITITSTSSVSGRMHGVGEVASGDQHVWFAFDVRERANNADRGWVMVQVRGGKGRKDRLLAANVSDVRLSTPQSSAPGKKPKGDVYSVVFSGMGRWNGAAGYRFEISAEDYGTPGKGHDTFSLNVFGPDGAVVESASGVLKAGDIQRLR